jgi:acyl transferase domain-containing protein
MQSVTSVFAPGRNRSRAIDNSLYVGTVESNIGHGEAAAGIIAFIKTMLVFQKGVIPPDIGIKTQLNPAFPELKGRNVIIPFEVTPWRSGAKRRLGRVNNFGAAGGNTSVIVEEATTRPKNGCDTRRAHVITLSAKTSASLRGNIERLSQYLRQNGELSVADLSYTLMARRAHYGHRLAVVAKDAREAVDLLTASHRARARSEARFRTVADHRFCVDRPRHALCWYRQAAVRRLDHISPADCKNEWPSASTGFQLILAGD